MLSSLFYFNFSIPDFKAEINSRISSSVFEASRLTRIVASAVELGRPNAERTWLTVFFLEEQAEPEETYIPRAER